MLSHYVQVATLRASALVAITLTGLFSLLEFVEQLASLGVTDALAYVALTAPARLLQVVPISMLLGALLALGGLARNAELTAMLSLGLPERRVIGKVLVLVVPIAAALFLLAEYVIPPAQSLAHARREAALSTPADRPDGRIWAHGGREYLHVDGFGPENEPVGIDIYALGADGGLARLTHAARASVAQDGTWLLHDVSQKQVADERFRTDHLPIVAWHAFISPRQLRLLTLPIDSIPPSVLFRQVFAAGRSQQDSTRYDQEFWTKASMPLSIVAMIMISAPFVFGRMRTQSTGQRLAYGVGFGIVFSLLQQIIDHLGLLLRVSPAWSASGPSLAIIVLALFLLHDVYWPERGLLPDPSGR